MYFVTWVIYLYLVDWISELYCTVQRFRVHYVCEFQYFTNTCVIPFVSGLNAVAIWRNTKFPLYVRLCMQWTKLRWHFIHMKNRSKILLKRCIDAFQFRVNISLCYWAYVTVFWLPDDNVGSFVRFRRRLISELPLIARFMGPTWGPSGADRTQVGPMLAPWTLLSGTIWKVE